MFILTAEYESGYVDHGHILPLTCPNCRQVTYWKMYEKRAQLTVYFVTVSDSSKGHILCCDSCRFTIALNADQVQRAHWLKQVTAAYFNRQINDDEYKKNLEVVRYLH